MNKQKDMTQKQLLQIRGLKIEAFDGDAWSEIVHGVDLDLKRGEVLGLIGESGAGKSTIGLAAMGFARDGCRISGGSIIFDGIDLRAASMSTLCEIRGRRIAYVAQSAASSFNPAYKIIDQFAEVPVRSGMMTRSQAIKDAVELNRKLHLPNPEIISLRYPHQMSGGQLQRAMTAMAMACRPDLIIFDEPTTALDVTTQIEVLASIRDVVKQFNTAAIYITHDLAVVSQIADKVKVLRNGVEVEEAATRQMLVAPRESYTKSLWAVRAHERIPQPSPASGEIPIVELRAIDARYGSLKVLDDVSIRIYRGRTLAVVGESGSGKSTAARVISGLMEPQKGQVLFNGQVLPSSFRKRSRDQLRQIQMIYQIADTALNPKLRIKDIIGRPVQFYGGLRGRRKEDRVRELLAAIELEPGRYMDRLPSELSGGQKQRIGIARALAASPQFLICDEVTSALDQIVAEGILKLLEKLQKELDLAYMFITHDLATVRAIADDIVVMKDGRVVDNGPSAQIFTPPHQPYTDLLLSSAPEMDPDWLTSTLELRAQNEFKQTKISGDASRVQSYSSIDNASGNAWHPRMKG